MGFVFSLVLTFVALSVLLYDISYTMVGYPTSYSFLQAAVQLVLFMHAGESEDKPVIYTNILYMLFFAIATILGTLLLFVWDM